MTIDPEHPESESIDEETLARHKRIAEVISGEREMDWDTWSFFIDESDYLTPKGKEVALWAVEILKQTLKDDFFQNVKNWLVNWNKTHPDLPLNSHPVFSYGLWPGANQLPWVYANLIRLAAQIQLFIHDNIKRAELDLNNNKVRRVLNTLHNNPEPINWASALIQLEVAGLGLKEGWQVQFEPKHRTGKKSDVFVTNGSDQLLVETTVMRFSEDDRKTLALSHDLSMCLMSIESRYNIRISGWLSSAALKNTNDRAQCLQAIKDAAQATADGGSSYQVTRPGQALLTIFRPTEETVYNRWEITGDTIGERPLERLIAILNDKNNQAKGSAIAVWLRIDEHAEMWQYLQMQGWTLVQIRDFFADFLQQELASFPYLAGVIISPGISWSTSNPPNLVVDRNENNESIVVSCPIPGGNRIRESIIVAQAGKFTEQARIFADWYSQESKWLNWALEKLRKPPFNELVYLSN